METRKENGHASIRVRDPAGDTLTPAGGSPAGRGAGAWGRENGCEVFGPDTSPSFVGLREDKLAGEVVREVSRMSRFAGAQWELRCPLARTDQWVRRRSARQERTDLRDCVGAQWEILAGARRPAASPSFECPPGDKALALRRLRRDGSLGVVRSPAPGSPGLPRFEPSTRGSFRKRAGFANLNRGRTEFPPPDRGLREKRGRGTTS